MSLLVALCVGILAYFCCCSSLLLGKEAFANGEKIHVSGTDKIVEDAGGTVQCMDGGKFSVFDRSVLVSNGLLHAKLLEKIGPATENLNGKGIYFSVWFKPENYHTKA